MKLIMENWRKFTNEEVDEALTEEEGCWDGYSPGAQTGKKTKKGKKGNRVNNCEEITEDEVKDKYGDEVQTGYKKKSAEARSEMGLEEEEKACKPSNSSTNFRHNRTPGKD